MKEMDSYIIFSSLVSENFLADPFFPLLVRSHILFWRDITLTLTLASYWNHWYSGGCVVGKGSYTCEISGLGYLLWCYKFDAFEYCAPKDQFLGIEDPRRKFLTETISIVVGKSSYTYGISSSGLRLKRIPSLKFDMLQNTKLSKTSLHIWKIPCVFLSYTPIFFDDSGVRKVIKE